MKIVYRLHQPITPQSLETPGKVLVVKNRATKSQRFYHLRFSDISRLMRTETWEEFI
jgi:hypothetical protein